MDGWPGQQFAILFRDWLRADASARAEYAELKVKAAESAAGIDDYAAAIDAYLGVKTPWFDAAFPPGMGVGREIRLVPLTTQRHVTRHAHRGEPGVEIVTVGGDAVDSAGRVQHRTL